MIEFHENFGKIPPKAIEEFESKFNLSLPKDYKEFLLDYNGGYSPEKNRFNSGKIESVIDSFYGIKLPKKDKGYSLERSIVMLEGRIPPTFIAIAADVFGNKILINLEDKSISFWDHEMEADEDQGDNALTYFDNISLISSSFTSFLNTLT